MLQKYFESWRLGAALATLLVLAGCGGDVRATTETALDQMWERYGHAELCLAYTVKGEEWFVNAVVGSRPLDRGTVADFMQEACTDVALPAVALGIPA